MSAKDKLLKHLDPVISTWRAQKKPFVWSLCLTYEFYVEADKLLMEAIAKENNDCRFLSSEKFAPASLIMIAEWYKRRYTGSNADNPLWIGSIDWERVWRNSGVRNVNRWTYTFENQRSTSWQYSARVLGGMPCLGIAKSNVSDRFLSNLCRMFHGEEGEHLLDPKGKARAVEMSVKTNGSVFHFIQQLLDKQSSLNKSMLADTQPEVKKLREKIENINKEVLKRRLRSEWIVTTSDYDPGNIYKALLIHLNPERVDGEPRWFLSFARAREWGFDVKQSLTEITVYVRFSHNGFPAGPDIPVIKFEATGKAESGYNPLKGKTGEVSNLPAAYEEWRLVAKGNDGQESILDVLANKELPYTQLYKTSKVANRWSSLRRRSDSAVLFSSQCTIVDPEGHPVEAKSVVMNCQPVSKVLWADIPVYVEIKDEVTGKTAKLTNPMAGCRLVVGRSFPDLIRYLPGGKIAVMDGIEDRKVPFAFGLDDIKMVWQDGDNEIVKNAEELNFTYRQNGRIHGKDDLRQGLVDVTASFESSMSAMQTVWYMPANGRRVPGIRDLDNHCIKWGTANNPLTYSASDMHDDDEMPETITIEYTSKGGAKAFFDVYQPVRRKEIILGNKMVACASDNKHLYLGLLNLDKIHVRIFDDSGFHVWVGKDHVDDFGSLHIISPALAETNVDNLFVINFEEKAIEDPRSLNIGGGRYEIDPDATLWEPPKYWLKSSRNIEDRFDEDPFGDDDDDETSQSSAVNAAEALEACIEKNLYSFAISELFRAPSHMISSLMEEVANRRGIDFMRENDGRVTRILREKNMTLNDLNFRL